ncbi:hypothetical protein [Lentzea aerocolonigenes]|uniref:hypothetical protein n=1 Tax=Lentzea aerocolonigenes TaxID=68170 RepID=UPI000A4655F8|nr:hypothetical protein [Lentzea aerocolonigenes]MCP2242455.1 hypothetical protein [Lentzea aerocolonigenes]
MTKRDRSGKAVSGVGQDAALGALATLASVALGANPIGATLVGGSAPVLKYLQQVWTQAGERRGDRAARSLKHAADLMDVGLDILVERAVGYDARLELLAQVLEAAARTSMEDKIQALGQILADGLRSDSHLDEARLLASMVNDLEAPHVVVLKLIAKQPVPPESMWSNPGGPRGWERTHVALALPDYDSFLDGVLAALVRHGALRTLGDGTWDGMANIDAHGITTLGIRCLQLFGHEPTEGSSVPDGPTEPEN